MNTYHYFASQQPISDNVWVRLLGAMTVAIIVAVVINRIIGFVVPRLVAFFTRNSAKTSERAEHVLEVRRVETLLGLVAGFSRAIVILACLVVAWKVVSPSSAPFALISVGTFAAVFAAATIGPLLRDFTTGIVMIIEKWYNVGDYVTLVPHELSGVVEKISLRSTKIRSLSGEVVWVHNQFIQAAKITPRGVRTISIDVFVHDLEAGRKMIKQALKSLPVGPTMIVKPMYIDEEVELGSVFQITVVGQTAPGREWLIEDFAVNVIKELDTKKQKIIAHGPIVRYTDAKAERSLTKSVIGGATLRSALTNKESDND
jgi:moderate conductance mechanosensitive channel